MPTPFPTETQEDTLAGDLKEADHLDGSNVEGGSAFSNLRDSASNLTNPPGDVVMSDEHAPSRGREPWRGHHGGGSQARVCNEPGQEVLREPADKMDYGQREVWSLALTTQSALEGETSHQYTPTGDDALFAEQEIGSNYGNDGE